MTTSDLTGSSHVEPLTLEELDALDEVKEIIDVARQASGYVPTSMRIMARKPNILRAFGGLIGTVLRQTSELPQEMKWLTAQAVSLSAGCLYCQAHTAANGAKNGLPVEKSQNILMYRDSDLYTDAEKAVIAFALAAGEVPNAVDRAQFDALRAHFTEGQIVELVAVISLFGWLNRWNDTFASDLEDAPRAFAADSLAGRGWEVGKHASD